MLMMIVRRSIGVLAVAEVGGEKVVVAVVDKKMRYDDSKPRTTVLQRTTFA